MVPGEAWAIAFELNKQQQQQQRKRGVWLVVPGTSGNEEDNTKQNEREWNRTKFSPKSKKS
jgi:hypothetical protein